MTERWQQRLVCYQGSLMKLIKAPDGVTQAWQLDRQTGAWISSQVVAPGELPYFSSTDFSDNGEYHPWSFVQAVVRQRAAYRAEPEHIVSPDPDPGTLRELFRLQEQQYARIGILAADPSLADYDQDEDVQSGRWWPFDPLPYLPVPPVPAAGAAPSGPGELLSRIRGINLVFQGALTPEILLALSYPLSLSIVAEIEDASAEVLATREIPVAECRGRLELLQGTTPDRWIIDLVVDRLRIDVEPPLADDRTVRQAMRVVLQPVIVVLEHYGLQLIDVSGRPDVAVEESASERQPRQWITRFRHSMTPQTLAVLRERLSLREQGRLDDPYNKMMGEALLVVAGEGAVVSLRRDAGTDDWHVSTQMFTATHPSDLVIAVAPLLLDITEAIVAIGSDIDAIE